MLDNSMLRRILDRLAWAIGAGTLMGAFGLAASSGKIRGIANHEWMGGIVSPPVIASSIAFLGLAYWGLLDPGDAQS